MKNGRLSRRGNREALRRWLQSNADPEDRAVLLHHLGDMRDACAEVVAFIDGLPNLDLSSRRGSDSVAALYGAITEHLLFHVKQVKRPLWSVLRRCTQAAYYSKGRVPHAPKLSPVRKKAAP